MDNFKVSVRSAKNPQKCSRLNTLKMSNVILYILHFHRKWLTSTTTSKTCQMTFTYKLEFFMYVVFTTNSIKMSRRLTILEHFSILDVHYNSNFLGVDVFLHQIFSKNVKMFLFLPLGRNEVRRSFSNDTTAGRLFFGQKQQW